MYRDGSRRYLDERFLDFAPYVNECVILTRRIPGSRKSLLLLDCGWCLIGCATVTKMILCRVQYPDGNVCLDSVLYLDETSLEILSISSWPEDYLEDLDKPKQPLQRPRHRNPKLPSIYSSSSTESLGRMNTCGNS